MYVSYVQGVMLAMTALLSPVTKYQEERCRCKTSADKWASCATEHHLMLDGAADDKCVVFVLK